MDDTKAIGERVGFLGPKALRGNLPVLLIAFLAIVLAVVNVANWLAFSRATRLVQSELGLRLSVVASSAVASATDELLLAPDVANDTFVRLVLEDLAERHDLRGAALLDREGIVLWELADLSVGERSAVVASQEVAFQRALDGENVVSDAFEIETERVMAAFTPVRDWDGTVEAVFEVNVGGGFFQAVPALRRTLVAISLASAGFVTLFGLLYFGLSRRLARADVAVRRSETLSAMGMMAAGVAHEVRNPLAIISGAGERLRRKYGSDDPDPAFDFIPEEVERLNRILEGYLRFARDEPLEFEECDLRQLAERTVKMLANDGDVAGVRFEDVTGEEELVAHVDEHRIQQVLLNLLLNSSQAIASRASDAGVSGGAVAVRVTRSGEQALIEVSDDGPGFSKKVLRNRFQPFLTTKEQGSGLGLVMAERIARGHGGAIDLANRPEGGASVTVTLPLTRTKP